MGIFFCFFVRFCGSDSTFVTLICPVLSGRETCAMFKIFSKRENKTTNASGARLRKSIDLTISPAVVGECHQLRAN